MEQDLGLSTSASSGGSRDGAVHAVLGLETALARLRQCRIDAVILECTQANDAALVAIASIRRAAGDATLMVLVRWGRVSAVASLIRAGADDVRVRGECTAEGLREALDACSVARARRREAERAEQQRVVRLIHDLRSPLQAVFSAIDLLSAEQGDPESRRRHMAYLVRAAEGLAAKLGGAEATRGDGQDPGHVGSLEGPARSW